MDSAAASNERLWAYAIIGCLTPLRAKEPDHPRFIDPSRETETRRSYPRKARS